MKRYSKLAVIPAVLALGAAPALAVASPPSSHAKAYGFYCKGESKKHVDGAKGTPFSQCVTAMNKIASGQTSSARKACKGESKKHVSGQKGTPFSQCVSAEAKLKADRASGDSSTS
jgi:hypothetical protein